MNLIITKRCDKGCPYCFASDARNHTKFGEWDMSFETFIEMLNKREDGPVKLLGGEPTSHPEFGRFVEELVKRNKEFTLISNFLFTDEVADIIIEAMKKVNVHFLINSSNLEDREGRYDTFVKNYNKVYDFLYVTDREENISCGITFENDKSAEYYIDYMQELNNRLDGIERFRVSIANPETKKEDFFILNNKELGKKFMTVTKTAVALGFTPSLDCIIYPCMFNNKEEWKYIKKFLAKVKTHCDGCPTDIFPDKTASYCYPLKEAIKVDTEKYDNISQVYNDMNLRYKILEGRVTQPEACKECSFKKIGMCGGPCLAFYDLSKETLGLNL